MINVDLGKAEKIDAENRRLEGELIRRFLFGGI